MQGITVHGLLAAYLALCPGALTTLEPWVTVWPTREEFKATMPIAWPQSISGLSNDILTDRRRAGDPYPQFLPPALAGARKSATVSGTERTGLLPHQSRKFRKDFGMVKTVYPAADLEEYMYFWLVVNTRTFYYVPPGRKAPSNPDDAMALCPFGDLFNHSSTGVSLTYLNFCSH